MSVKEQLIRLASLAQKDILAKELIEKLQSFASKINNIKDLSLILCNKEQLLEIEKKQLELERQQVSLEIQTEKNILRKWEQRADKIKGEREYSILISEIGIQKKIISQLETKILEVYEKQDIITNKLSQINQELNKNNLIYEKELKQNSAEITLLENELRNLNTSRDEIIKELPKIIAKRYEQIALRRSGIAITFISDNVCHSCKRILPHELCNQVAKYELLETCPNCNRFMVQEN